MEMIEQRRSMVPGHSRRPLHDIVAGSRRDRNDAHRWVAETRGERRELRRDLFEAVLVKPDEVHFVDSEQDVTDAEQSADKGVTLVCGSTPLRASTRITASSQLEAPVA